MEFIKQKFKRGEKAVGVYRLNFNTGYFYIDSSCSLRSRMNAWKVAIFNPKYLRNKDISFVLNEETVITFEVIESVSDTSIIKDVENKHISKHWGNVFLLNRCPDAYSPKGMRPYFGYEKPVKEKSTYVQFCRTIAEYTVSGDIVKIHKSITSLCKEKKIPSDMVHKILLGKRGQPKTFHIKEVLPNGEVLMPPSFKRTLGDMCKPKEKKVNVIDLSGNVITTCFNIAETSKYLNCSNALVRYVLDGGGKCNHKTAKGFFLKYA